MVDTETLGTRFNSALVSIGACLFEPETGEITSRFYRIVDLADACKYGRVDGATIRFWLNQGDAARQQMTKGTEKLEQALEAFRVFYTNAGAIPIWSNGASFDIPIIEFAYQQCLGQTAPWDFWNVRDCRTIEAMARDLYKRPKMDEGAAHNALFDAVFQAQYVSKMWQALLRVTPKPRVDVDDL